MRDWLIKLREKAGLSQLDVAKRAKISQSYYSSIESGIRGSKLPQPTARKIADALGFEWTCFYTDGR